MWYSFASTRRVYASNACYCKQKWLSPTSTLQTHLSFKSWNAWYVPMTSFWLDTYLLPVFVLYSIWRSSFLSLLTLRSHFIVISNTDAMSAIGLSTSVSMLLIIMPSSLHTIILVKKSPHSLCRSFPLWLKLHFVVSPLIMK